MARLPKLIIMIAAFTAIFLWLSTAFNACGNNADDLLGDTIEVAGEVAEDADEFVEDFSEDIFEDDGDDLFEEDDTYESDYVSGDEAEEEVDFTEVDPEPVASTSTSYSTSSSSNSSYSAGGEYLVIAGNYLVESNAKEMTRKLSNLGYPSADIGVFDRSQYHTVIASRHSSYSSALEVENAIKRQGIDCYVKKKQY